MTQGNNLLLTITGKDLSSETILFWFLILHLILVGYYGSGTVMSYAIMHLKCSFYFHYTPSFLIRLTAKCKLFVQEFSTFQTIRSTFQLKLKHFLLTK